MGTTHRSRKRKVKDNDLVTTAKSLMDRLDNLTIREEERAVCRVTEECQSRFKQKINKYKK